MADAAADTPDTAAVLRLPHHLWVRVRVESLVLRRDINEIVTDAFVVALADMLDSPREIPPPDFLSELRLATSLLSQVEALYTLYTAPRRGPPGPPAKDERAKASGSVLRDSHVKGSPDRLTPLRPRISRELWNQFKGYCLYRGLDPNVAARKALEDYLHLHIPAGSKPEAELREALIQVRDRIAALIDQLALP